MNYKIQKHQNIITNLHSWKNKIAAITFLCYAFKSLFNKISKKKSDRLQFIKILFQIFLIWKALIQHRKNNLLNQKSSWIIVLNEFCDLEKENRETSFLVFRSKTKNWQKFLISHAELWHPPISLYIISYFLILFPNTPLWHPFQVCLLWKVFDA